MKYFAKKVKYNGMTFDSKAERDRYILLLDRQKKGEILDLQTQKEFELIPKQVKKVQVKLKTKTKIVEKVDERAVMYHCDFYYYDRTLGMMVIEEVKSKMTAKVRDYPLRRKLIKLMVAKMNEKFSRDVFKFNEIIVK